MTEQQNNIKKKEWKDMSRKEKTGGIVGVFVIAFIVIAIFSAIFGSSETKESNNQAINDAQSSGTSLDSKLSNTEEKKPVPPPKPKVYKGSGDDVITIQKPADGAAILAFDCPRCTSNTVVKTNGAESLLVNTIGSYSGSHLVDVSEGGITSSVTVTAVGAWTLTVSGLDKAMQLNGQNANGTGDSVIHVTGNTTKANVENTGESNFVVNIYPENGGFADLAVNTIGSYKGTVPMEAPAYVQITSSGKWKITTE